MSFSQKIEAYRDFPSYTHTHRLKHDYTLTHTELNTLDQNAINSPACSGAQVEWRK